MFRLSISFWAKCLGIHLKSFNRSKILESLTTHFMLNVCSELWLPGPYCSLKTNFIVSVAVS